MRPLRQWLSRAARGVAAAGRFAVSDGLLLAGGGTIAYGAWLTFEPAGFVIAGLELALFGWFVGGK